MQKPNIVSKFIRGIAIASMTMSGLFFHPSVALATTPTEMRAQQTDLYVIYEVSPTSTDKMSTASRSEASQYTMNGQVYYLPRTLDSTKNTFFRLHDGVDHMDSTVLGEAGYTTEGPIGYPWKNAYKPDGTSQLFRGTNASGDHALQSQYLTFNGYSIEGFSDCYGYPRFGGGVNLFTLTGSQITVKSNLVAGGSIWEFWWNNKQFINTDDYGRQMQSSMGIGNDPASAAMPTEAGDGYNIGDKNYWHGSPIASYGNTITSSLKTQSTRAIPLEWNNTYYNGNNYDLPVCYADWKLGKDIRLDDSSLSLGSGYENLVNQVARYDTVLSHPTDIFGDIEIPTAYLEPEFNRGFTFDSTVSDIDQATHEVSNSEFTGEGNGAYVIGYRPNAGGVIYANSNLSYAMGVYGSNVATGGNVAYFSLWKFGNPDSPYVTKFSAAARQSYTAGENRFTTYICVGTFDQVRTEMRQLYVMGYR